MLQITVCIGSSCQVKGAYNVVQTFQQMIEEFKLHDVTELHAVMCMKQCQSRVSVKVEESFHDVSPETARDFFRTEVIGKLAGAAVKP